MVWEESIQRGTETTGQPPRKRLLWLLAIPVLCAGLGLLLWRVGPSLLPQSSYYDFVANYRVTERLVGPDLFKIERWEISGDSKDVLFVHPAPGGSTALVYPVRLEPNSVFRSDLAVAPEAWVMDGDGVTFSLYVEDEAGMHLLYSCYVDPKHHEQDRRWLPMRVDLAPFRGKLVRLILAVGSGPAGDRRNDWAGWGAPRLEHPAWP
jgi:hypothetical protein